MIPVTDKIHIGTDKHCTFRPPEDWAIIHACKHPCHVKAVGYKGNLSKYHPNYLILEMDKHLVLNMVDMEREFHPDFTNPIMVASISFIDKYIGNNKVLIHCNQGQSRSPSIAMIYLAKTGVISNGSLAEAAKSFKEMYKPYFPGRGITAYMNRNWDYLMNL